MSYLDDGVIRVGVNLDAGGAITHLSLAGERAENLVNNWDWGRQVQMSHYSGPVPFVPAGAEVAKVWEALGWNPVQAGDAFKHASRVTSFHNDGKTIELTCVPMQWPLNNVPSECEFSTRLSLEGDCVHVECKLTNHRADHTQYAARGQELPAVYTIGKLYRLFSYTGDKPFTGDAITRIAKRKAPPGILMPQWSHWSATENWSALVDDHDFGIGVWNPQCFESSGGFWGKEGTGQTHDDPTGYIGPTRADLLDHNIVYRYSYALIVGSIDRIRAFAVDHGKSRRLPAWIFRYGSRRLVLHQRQRHRLADSRRVRRDVGPERSAVDRPAELLAGGRCAACADRGSIQNFDRAGRRLLSLAEGRLIHGRQVRELCGAGGWPFSCLRRRTFQIAGVSRGDDAVCGSIRSRRGKRAIGFGYGRFNYSRNNRIAGRG